MKIRRLFFFRIRDFPLIKAWDSGFQNKIGARLGIENRRAKWDAIGIMGLH